MKMTVVDLPDGVAVAKLEGRMDVAGANAVDLQFNVMAGSKRAVVIDLSEVSFMASMGMRTLVMGAKTIASKGGKLVLLSPTSDVGEALTTGGIDTVVPIYYSRDEAVAAVKKPV